MDGLIKERPDAPNEEIVAEPVRDLPQHTLARIQALYDQGLCLQAYELGIASLPLRSWRGVEANILAGRILLNLGAVRLSSRHRVRAFRLDPGQIRTRAYYLETVLTLRGPVLAWQLFRRFEAEALATSPIESAGDGWEYLFCLGARICAHFRDFDQAEARLKVAATRGAETPWFWVENAAILAMHERWDEAVVMARQTLAARPDYRPAVQQLAQFLHSTSRDDEALALLQDASLRIESIPLLVQFTALQMDLEKYAGAIDTMLQIRQLSPVLDKSHEKWLAAQQCRAHCALGHIGRAETSARLLDDEYHVALAGRLHALEKPLRRVQINVPFIQQFRMTCVPATLAMLCRFWNLPADHVELSEALCYDGTPSHRARRWAEANGLRVCEFTLNWDIAVALLEQKIPFAVFTTEATSAHVQVVAGYDALRHTFIIRDPAFPQIQEVDASLFLKRYRATGPAGMVLVPAADAGWLAGLEFADADLYDQLRHVQENLENHRRDEAGAGLDRMRAASPDHWLTLTAGRAVYSYDTNLPALLDCFDQLLAQFPEDGNLLAARLSCTRENGRREERLEALRQICQSGNADPAFRQQLAQELMSDARRNAEAERQLKMALRGQPLNTLAQTTLANLYWNQRRFDDALDVYRFAACVDDKKEPAAQAYFTAANACRKSREALEFLHRRSRENIGKSAAPFITWFHALRQLDRSADAARLLEETLRDYPAWGDLWLTAADVHARQSEFDQSAQCLAKAEGKVPPQSLLNARAQLFRYKGDLASALELWREALRTEPLAMSIHRSLAWVLAENEGSAATLKYLRSACERFPYHYQLHQLWCEWARQAGPEAGEEAVRVLLNIYPNDAWARREMALVLADGARFQEALGEAEAGLRLEPHHVSSYTTRAAIHTGLGQIADARADYQHAIRLSVDCGPAIHGLVNSGSTVAERREFIAFVEAELARQTVFGDGLRAYCDAARLNLEPEGLLASLRAALQNRPDLAAAWSVVINQLAGMLQLDEALCLARQAAAQFPLLEKAWLDLALVQRLRLDLAGEREALEQAMRVSPADSVAPRMLAHHFERLGELSWAREKIELACARSPLDAASHGVLATILWRQGKQPAALERLRHALKLQPGYLWGWQTLGQWAAATGEPKLAEDLAKIMVLQRPGEGRSLLVLARILKGSRRFQEALPVVNQALALYPRNAEAHELRAEILAALQRNAEADAACEPEVFGGHLPASLRACRARLEAARGNLRSATDRLKEVMRENPGYSGGWQNLADWLWRQNEFDEAMSAATNVRRLDPLNPLPLGYRASLKLQRKDRAGARADLEFALKLDPAYEFASLNAFELQLEDGDIEAARRTLEGIRRYSGNEKAAACEIKLRTKFLQSLASQKPGAVPSTSPAVAVELDEAFARFNDLCRHKSAKNADFDMAIQALLKAGHQKRVDQTLEAAIVIPECHPSVGTWWMQRRWDRGKRRIPSAVRRLCPASAAARNAVSVFIKKIAEQKPFTVRRSLIALIIGKMLKLIEREARTGALAWLAWHNRHWLRSDTKSWADMGYALVNSGRFVLAGWWMRDWRDRTDVQMWMLYNLVVALRSRGRSTRVAEVLKAALGLPGHDHTFPKLRLIQSFDLALAGRPVEAAALFRELGGEGWSGSSAVRYCCVRGLLAVQQAAPDERKRVFDLELAAIRKAMTKNGVTRYSTEYRSCAAKMARDAGQRWRSLFLWLGY